MELYLKRASMSTQMEENGQQVAMNAKGNGRMLRDSIQTGKLSASARSPI